MLGSRNAATALAVKDLARARAFYEGILGLAVADDGTPGVLVLRSGASRLVVYESAFAGTNRATAAMWGVGGDLDGIVRDLRAAGSPSSITTTCRTRGAKGTSMSPATCGSPGSRTRTATS